jgi:hypothetical protein
MAFRSRAMEPADLPACIEIQSACYPAELFEDEGP